MVNVLIVIAVLSSRFFLFKFLIAFPILVNRMRLSIITYIKATYVWTELKIVVVN